MNTAATLVVGGVALYAVIGLAVAAAFIAIGIDRVLESPADVSPGARMLIFPGAAALWPYVLKRWASAGRAP